RLDLRNALLLGPGQRRGMLMQLSEDPAAVIIKAPGNNVLGFALSSRATLVEDDEEFIPTEAF
ncbi:ATP-dependent endonuclease, partial [Pseudomonas aeruginosa]